MIYRCGECVVDPLNRRFLRGSAEIALEPRVFAVIVELLAHAPGLVSRNELLDAVWGHRYVTDSTVSRVIILARRAFGDGTESPHYIQTVRGAGYRYVGPIEELTPPETVTRLQFEPPPVHRIPARLEELIGREADLGRIAALLGEFRGVTILGPGGMGKTQCAYECARRAGDFHPDGVWLFDLAQVQVADEWFESLGMALSIRLTGIEQTRRDVLRYLSDRNLLLVLDNCERIAPELGALVLDVLRHCEQVRVLATSQRPLNYLGERLFRLPPLELPVITHPANDAELAEVARASAIALLVRRIQAADPAFEIRLGNAPALIELCARLDAMPLALEFAAPRYAMLSPEQVLERLQQRFDFLVSSAAGRDSRHRNLQAVLSWAYALLGASEQRLLAWLSVFVQGWTAASAVALAAHAGYSPESVIDVMNGLVDKSLVAVDLGRSPPRYRLLESVREFALAILTQTGEMGLARDGHMHAIEALTQTAFHKMRNGQLLAHIDQLAEEHGNVGAALDHACTGGRDAELGQRIVADLVLYMGDRSLSNPGLDWCRMAAQGSSCVGGATRARFLLSYGVLRLGSAAGDPHDMLLEAQSLAHESGDMWTEAFAAAYRTLSLIIADDMAAAIELLLTVAAIAEKLGDATVRRLLVLAEGWVCFSRGALEECIRIMDPSRREGSSGFNVIMLHGYVGLAHYRLGQLASAATVFAEGFQVAAAHRSLRGNAGLTEGSAYLAHLSGEHVAAAQLLGAARSMREASGMPLLRFWRQIHADVEEALRATLGTADYEAAVARGAGTHFERAIEAAGMILKQVLEGKPPGPS